MAQFSTNAPVSVSITGWATRTLNGFFDALIRMGENNPKLRQMDALMALSDEDLANRGLRRDEIARYVLSGSNWI